MKFHRSQVFLIILLAFIGGVFMGSFVAIAQTYIWIGILVCTLSIAVFFRRDSRALNPKIAFGALIALIFLIGFTRINIDNSRKHLVQEFAKASAEMKDIRGKNMLKADLMGFVDSEPEASGKTQTFVFYSKALGADGILINTDERVMVRTDLYPQYEYGQTIELNGVIQLPANPASSSMDYAAYLAKDDIFTTAFMPSIKEIDLELNFSEKTKIYCLKKIYSVKKAFENSINRSVSEPNAAFLNGILLGTRSRIPNDLKNAFATTGTTHILAISGYNISIVAGMIVSFLLYFFKRPKAFWFSVVAILIFTVMTGAQASVVRAAIMGCLLLFANREGRPYAARNAIILAGAMMILINPNILRNDVGFQLSFLATLGLVYFAPFFSEKFSKIPSFFGLRENLAMTVSAQIAVLPLILFFFQKLSVVSLPANILVLPLVPFSMALGFITGIAGMILPILGQIAGYFAWFLTSIQIWLIRFFSSPSWASLSVGFPWYILIIIYAILIFVVVKYLHVGSRTESK
jgi:competence protein ComEC